MFNFVGWQELRVITSDGESVSIKPTRHYDSEDVLTRRISVLQGLVERLNQELSASTALLQERMDARGTTRLTGVSPDPDGSPPMSAQIKEYGIRYDHDKLDAIMERELIPQDVLVRVGALVPAHDKIVAVPRKWYVGPLKELARRYPEVGSIIEEARTVGSRKIVVS